MQKITPFLWFDNNAEEAMNFYTSVFKNSKTEQTSSFGEGGPGKGGKFFTGTFKLAGEDFMVLNGGPMFKFTEAISLFVSCETQEEVDYFWDKLSEGGQKSQCGWLKDKYGPSWQILPTALAGGFKGKDPAGAARAMQGMMQMTKLDIATLRRAYEGK